MSHTILGQGNPHTFGCVHAAGDGKLSGHNVSTLFAVENKREIIKSLLNVINERANPQIKEWGLRGISIILNDTGAQPNYQAADGLFACDVLIEIILYINKINDLEVIDTALNHICEQMSDMIQTNGTCPSGRVNRLFSILSYLRHYMQNYENNSQMDTTP